jgi:hypothetical protein
MKKISTAITALSLLCAGLQSADAGLVGMPLNLKASVGQAGLDGSASPAVLQYPSCHFFYTDDVFTGLVLVSSC